jgi:hypothetical protein
MNRLAVIVFAVFSTLGSTYAETFSTDELAQRAVERRAVEAVIWGMPAVNYDLMLQAMLRETPAK